MSLVYSRVTVTRDLRVCPLARDRCYMVIDNLHTLFSTSTTVSWQYVTPSGISLGRPQLLRENSYLEGASVSTDFVPFS